MSSIITFFRKKFDKEKVMATWADLTINLDQINKERLIESWDWLIGKDKTPVLISSIGDLFLSDNSGKHFWLDVGDGTISEIASSKEEFETKLKDEAYLDEWFLPELVTKIKTSGLNLSPNFIYGYKTIPILGGLYEPDNFELTNIEVHFELSGQIHKQIQDLPNGTPIRIEVTE